MSLKIESLRIFACTCIYIQWNLRIKDKLVHGPLSTIRRLSFMGGFCQKGFKFCIV